MTKSPDRRRNKTGPRTAWRLHMRDLVEQTGFTRQAIHFYIREGLVPRGRKTHANQAVYGEVHVRRLELIRRLKREHFLPLRAVRALIGGTDDTWLSPAQRAALDALRGSLGVAGHDGDAHDGEALSIEPDDLGVLVSAGVVDLAPADPGARDEEAEIVALTGRLRATALRPERGFTAEDLRGYIDAVDALVRAEVALLSERVPDLEERRAIAAATAPMVSRLLALLRTRRLRTALEGTP